MNLEPAPRLSKTVFLVIDAVLLITAFLIVYFSKNPYAPLPFVSAVLCVVLAALVALVPFLIDYAADSAEYVQAERERVAEHVQRLHAASESLSRAAAQIKAVEEAVHKAAHTAENLPYRMQEKLAEFNEALAAKEEGDHEALEQELADLRATNSDQLRAIADKIHKATTDWAALETATRKQLATAQTGSLAAAEAALARVQQTAGDTAAKVEARLTAALATLDAKLAALASAGTVAAHPAPAPAPEPAATVVPATIPASAPAPVVESVAVHEIGTPAEPALLLEEHKPRKPRAPRKPRSDEPTPPADGSSGSSDTAPAGNADDSSAPPAGDESAAAPAEASASSDGATRLLATAYIGIGNKLFIRGEGPGLSWDKGVPMQFVSIGKWGWATHEAAAPVRCTLYKNDDTAALTGEITLEPGKHVEVTAFF